jgi:Tol biopolymer transport system component/C-terminal processing protease CtpA/Prc
MLALAFSGVASAQSPEAASLPSFAEPALSPDGQTIAFVSGGDIWEVPAQGGTAHLVVSDAATEGRPFYSPDGTKLAFTSTRGGGNANIYVLDLASARVTRITWAEVSEELNGWSPDGRWLYFSSAAKDIGRFTDVFRVTAAGGTPVQVTRETYLPEFQASPSPDGKRLAVLARGSMAAGQYWRNGHSNIDKTELWLKDLAQEGGYTQVVAPDAKQAWPMWSPDGATITYMSDQDGTENLWQIGAAGGEARQLTRFTDGRVLFPQTAANGSGIVFERDFVIWRYDTASGIAAPVEIALRGAPAGPSTQNVVFDSFDELAVAPDGKKVAIAGRGELFGLPTKDGTTERLTTSVSAEAQATWSPDSRRLLYVGERGTEQHLFEYDAASRKETRLTTGGASAAPVYSPDGKSAVYIRDRRELRLVALPRPGVAASERTLFSGQIDPNWTSTPPVWSPDGQYVAFVNVDAKSFANVFIVPAAGGAARQASFLANGQTAGMAWSPDGEYILLSSGQRAEPQRIVRIDLLPNVPSFREDVFRSLFGPGEQPGTPEADKPASERPAKEEAKPADRDAKPKVSPVRVAWDGLRQRATFLPLGMDAYSPTITSDGKTLIFLANVGGSQNLYSYNLDELANEPPRPKQISATPGPKGSFGLSADGKSLWYLDGGKVMATPVPEASPKPLPARADLSVEFDAEKQVVFDQAWSLLDTYFYDPKYHGVDWDAARQKWQPYINGARTPAEVRRNIGLMIGELNASHSGIGHPAAVENNRVGDIGISFERTAYEANGALVVRDLVPLGPAAVTGKIAPGDRVVSVDGIDTTGRNFDQLLERKIGKQVALGVQTPAGERRAVTVQPAPDDVVTGLRYRGWVEERRALVERLSGGRLGYVHIADMGDASLDQLQIDLDAANQNKRGVVVDVRNNNGGYVHGRVLDILSRSNFLSMTQRGMSRFPARQALGQRALGLPTVVLANESTLSDGEDFMEGYRALGLGKMVGRDSAGWIIYTSNQPLIDGSVVRVPSLLIEGANGDNMELAGRKVDIEVQRPLGDTVRGDDSQLAMGVKVLLDQLGG